MRTVSFFAGGFGMVGDDPDSCATAAMGAGAATGLGDAKLLAPGGPGGTTGFTPATGAGAATGTDEGLGWTPGYEAEGDFAITVAPASMGLTAAGRGAAAGMGATTGTAGFGIAVALGFTGATGRGMGVAAAGGAGFAPAGTTGIIGRRAGFAACGGVVVVDVTAPGTIEGILTTRVTLASFAGSVDSGGCEAGAIVFGAKPDPTKSVSPPAAFSAGFTGVGTARAVGLGGG